ncbi:MAG: ABC transporter substrate-binding protein, partial [Dehalococcoidia bacterium]|nr:ABC transporter substrate-binding protein [Dehalococcoidia bacterium]
MRILRRFLFLALIVGTACAPAAPTTPTGGSTTPTRADNQVIRIGFSFSPASMSPAAALTPIPFAYWPMYDNLTMYGPNYEVRPSAASRWEVSPDGRTWLFTIRNDIPWPDGTMMSADDVTFTFGQMRERRWFNSGLFANVVSVRTVDPQTVEFVMRSPDMTMPNLGANMWIIPQRYYTQVGADGFTQRPLGSGPYELIDFRQNDLIHFRRKATPHPFRRPANDELIFRTIPEGAQKVNGLRGNELDVVAQSSFSVEQLDQLRGAGIQFISSPASIIMISMPEGTYMTNNTPLRDRRVRLALNYAIDRVTIARTFYRDTAQPLGQIGLPGSLYFDPSVPPFPYDPAQARRLLAEAGYPNGFRLQLDTSAAQNLRDVLLAVQGQLREIGIDVEINSLDGGEYNERQVGANNRMKGDLWTQISSDTNGFGSSIRTVYGCGRPTPSPNVTFYCNPRWDQLMDQALAERDPA